MPMLQGPISLVKTKMFIKGNTSWTYAYKITSLEKVNSADQDVNIIRKEWQKITRHKQKFLLWQKY